MKIGEKIRVNARYISTQANARCSAGRIKMEHFFQDEIGNLLVWKTTKPVFCSAGSIVNLSAEVANSFLIASSFGYATLITNVRTSAGARSIPLLSNNSKVNEIFAKAKSKRRALYIRKHDYYGFAI